MTSIEWLEGQFKIYLPSIHQKGLEDAFQKAKEMHKAETEKRLIMENLQFEKDYIHSYTDAISFMSHLQHETVYEVLDLVNNKWEKQNYTFLVDNNEQEQTQKMIHWYRMGWCRLWKKDDFDKPFMDFAKQYFKHKKD